MKDIALELHKLFNNQKRYHYPLKILDYELPQNGIYIMFENKEKYNNLDRIVNVGTHTGNNQLRSRLNQHFVMENKNRSILRKNIGRCFLNMENSPYLSLWELDTTSRDEKEKHFMSLDLVFESQVEKRITDYMASKEERRFWKSKIISTLVSSVEIKPSTNWLGSHSPKEKIRAYGLWQVNELFKGSITELEFGQLKELVLEQKGNY